MGTLVLSCPHPTDHPQQLDGEGLSPLILAVKKAEVINPDHFGFFNA